MANGNTANFEIGLICETKCQLETVNSDVSIILVYSNILVSNLKYSEETGIKSER